MNVAERAQPVGRFVDLHMHSRASDGSHSPAEVVAIAHSVGVEAIALTDHDTLAGLPEAVAAGERLGVRVITGVELSAMDGADEVHILGLHLARTQDMELTLADFRERRVNRAGQMVERLNALGVPVKIESVLALSGGGAIGRPHLARALVEGGWVRDSREAFDRYLGNGRPASVPKARIGIRDAIQLIHQAGGLAVWAHPGSLGRRARLEQLRALGLDGVEVRHPGHAVEDMTRLKALADHLDLVPSGGSDWHGALEGPRTMGAMHVPAEWIELQEARLRARAA